MLKLGDKNIARMKAGSREVLSAWLNGQEVWNCGSYAVVGGAFVKLVPEDWAKLSNSPYYTSTTSFTNRNNGASFSKSLVTTLVIRKDIIPEDFTATPNHFISGYTNLSNLDVSDFADYPVTTINTGFLVNAAISSFDLSCLSGVNNVIGDNFPAGLRNLQSIDFSQVPLWNRIAHYSLDRVPVKVFDLRPLKHMVQFTPNTYIGNEQLVQLEYLYFWEEDEYCPPNWTFINELRCAYLKEVHFNNMSAAKATGVIASRAVNNPSYINGIKIFGTNRLEIMEKYPNSSSGSIIRNFIDGGS
jgi:hypothetical protein